MSPPVDSGLVVVSAKPVVVETGEDGYEKAGAGGAA
jgi:hypothetical protein